MNELEIQAQERLSKNAFMNYCHIEMVSIQPDRATFRLEIRPENRNPFGNLHGGAFYTLADNAAGAAAHTDGRFYVTQQTSYHFLRGQGEGTVYSKAMVRHRGRSTWLVYVDIVNEEDKLLGTAEFTFFSVAANGRNEKK